MQCRCHSALNNNTPSALMMDDHMHTASVAQTSKNERSDGCENSSANTGLNRSSRKPSVSDKVLKQFKSQTATWTTLKASEEHTSTEQRGVVVGGQTSDRGVASAGSCSAADNMHKPFTGRTTVASSGAVGSTPQGRKGSGSAG